MLIFIKYIDSIVVLHLNKVQEKPFNFKSKSTRANIPNEISAIRNCNDVFIKTHENIQILSQKK